MINVGKKENYKKGLEDKIELKIADSEKPFSEIILIFITAGFGVRNFET